MQGMCLVCMVVISYRVFRISGIEWWNRMLEWNVEVKYWKGILE